MKLTHPDQHRERRVPRGHEMTCRARTCNGRRMVCNAPDLRSTAYGPEAALTLLPPLGTAGVVYMVPIGASI